MADIESKFVLKEDVARPLQAISKEFANLTKVLLTQEKAQTKVKKRSNQLTTDFKNKLRFNICHYYLPFRLPELFGLRVALICPSICIAKCAN